MTSDYIEYLSREDLVNLTGKKQPKRQVKWLRENRWVFEVSSTGEPKILRAYHDERMLGKKVLVKPDFRRLKRKYESGGD